MDYVSSTISPSGPQLKANGRSHAAFESVEKERVVIGILKAPSNFLKKRKRKEQREAIVQM